MGHPGFFKSFKPEDSSEQMTLPLDFTKSIQDRLPKLVVLTDENNNFWQVKVGKIGGETCFQDGWATFLEDVLVKERDLLMFEYFCEGMFKVKLFDVCAREKQKVGKFIFKGIGWKENNLDENKHVKKEVTDEDYVEVEVENNKEWVEVEEEEDIDYKDVDEYGEEEDEEVEEELAQVEKDGSDTNGKRRQRRRINDLGEDTIEKPIRRRRITNNSCEELFRSGLAVRPKNSYFLAQITSRKRELYVPMRIVKSRRTINLEKVTYFLDPTGNSWDLKYRTWKGGRVTYTGQWRKFCLQLKEGDMCICEFIKRRRDPYLKVQIVSSS